MRFLLDTNILIPAEPTSPGEIESTTSQVVQLLGLLTQGGHMAVVHPASVGEVRGDRNAERGSTRVLLLRRYPELPHPPAMSSRIVAELGAPSPGSNTAVDLLLLSSVDANAVDYFVTEDERLHRRARRVGLGDRVLTSADAILTVRALFPTVPTAPPFVTALLAHQLNDADPIFNSFRQDYLTFDAWLAKCKREHRQAWVVSGGSQYAGVCIVNDESRNPYGFSGKVLKVCSFKIAEQFRGYRYGELLLKTIFAYAVQNSYVGMFVEAYAKQQELFTLLADFGFEDVQLSSKGERVLFKRLRPPAEGAAGLHPLEYNIRYGPNSLTLSGAKTFVVPIQPRYHRLLFPELETQLALATESHPFGNSIRKAYLSNSRIRKIASGDAVLFYRSTENQAVTAIGVVEGTAVSSDGTQVATFVGRRTVYSFADIQRMVQQGPVLAVLFRLARPVTQPWSLDLLIRAGIIKRAPQSFLQVSTEAVAWIANQLDVPH
jgi:hypothetical protein